MAWKKESEWQENLLIAFAGFVVVAIIGTAVAGCNEWLYEDWRCMFKNCRVLVQ